MPYLNVDVDYFDHPKTKRLVGLLGRGADVLPIKLWSYCGKFHAESGKLTSYSEQEIETIVGWWGKEGVMMEAIAKVGFAEKIEGGWQIHQWQEHEGHIFAFKARAVKASTARWECYKHATSIAKDEAKQCLNRTVPTVPTVPEEGEPAGAGAPLPREAAFWNTNCGTLPKVLSFSSSRQKHLKARRQDPFWTANFEAAVIRVKASDFCCGKNDRGWVADFGWLIERPDTISKIIEGKYDNRAKAGKPNPRNVGVIVGPTDYGEAAKRKVERQALEAKARGEY